MKKARIALTAIAVLAIAGASFAYQSQKKLGSLIFTTAVYGQVGAAAVDVTTTAIQPGEEAKVYFTLQPNTPAYAYEWTTVQP
ncbi:hypothetical protein SAMN05421788_10333 [Filimonas lacunae]|uniref:Chagasin family peptidase inhibitor I42 n=1 Tax=Filimonas lacunae TaxID=477680 RepID=A0A173MJ96_9BACT|nr:hypothetical protein [Filimonas lacunae]BAV07684.1 hypothetical protein FLA_3715 [Filimonas lacunae]SIT03490.1 hypothetical protein SAMN05421788_10333 [Filimonas lacunae]